MADDKIITTADTENTETSSDFLKEQFELISLALEQHLKADEANIESAELEAELLKKVDDKKYAETIDDTLSLIQKIHKTNTTGKKILKTTTRLLKKIQTYTLALAVSNDTQEELVETQKMIIESNETIISCKNKINKNVVSMLKDAVSLLDKGPEAKETVKGILNDAIESLTDDRDE